jgi:lysozyme
MRHIVFMLLVLCVTQNQFIDETIIVLEDIEVDASDTAKDLIQKFEGFRANPYADGGGVPTIGFGTIMYPDGTRVALSDPPITEEVALGYLMTNLQQKCDHINPLIKVPVTQNQFDAICSFTYNVGVHSLAISMLLKKLNDSDYAGAADEFLKWKYDNGVVESGLVKRRQAERDLFLKSDVSVASK